MGFAVGSATFRIERLAFEIFVTHGTLETLRVVVIVEGFDPSITGFDRKTTSDTLGGEQFVPVFFTVWLTILKIERVVTKGYKSMYIKE